MVLASFGSNSAHFWLIGSIIGQHFTNLHLPVLILTTALFGLGVIWALLYLRFKKLEHDVSMYTRQFIDALLYCSPQYENMVLHPLIPEKRLQAILYILNGMDSQEAESYIRAEKSENLPPLNQNIPEEHREALTKLFYHYELVPERDELIFHNIPVNDESLNTLNTWIKKLRLPVALVDGEGEVITEDLGNSRLIDLVEWVDELSAEYPEWTGQCYLASLNHELEGDKLYVLGLRIERGKRSNKGAVKGN